MLRKKGCQLEQWLTAGANSRDGVGVGTSAERVDLGRVQPGELEPSRSKEEEEQEKAENGALRGGFGLGSGRVGIGGNQAGEGDDHRDTLSGGTDEEHLATTDTLNDGVRGEGAGGVDCGSRDMLAGRGLVDSDEDIPVTLTPPRMSDKLRSRPRYSSNCRKPARISTCLTIVWMCCTHDDRAEVDDRVAACSQRHVNDLANWLMPAARTHLRFAGRFGTRRREACDGSAEWGRW